MTVKKLSADKVIKTIKKLSEDEILEYLRQVEEIGNEFYEEAMKVFNKHVVVNNPLNYKEFEIAYAFTVNDLMQKIQDVNNEIPKEFSMKQIPKYKKIEELHNKLLRNYDIIFRATELEVIKENLERNEEYLTSSGNYTYLGTNYNGKLITFWSVLPFAPIQFSFTYKNPIFLVGKKLSSCYPTFYTPLSRQIDHDLGEKMRRLPNGKILSVQFYKFISEVEFICEKYPIKDIIGYATSTTFYNAYARSGFEHDFSTTE